MTELQAKTSHDKLSVTFVSWERYIYMRSKDDNRHRALLKWNILFVWLLVTMEVESAINLNRVPRHFSKKVRLWTCFSKAGYSKLSITRNRSETKMQRVATFRIWNLGGNFKSQVDTFMSLLPLHIRITKLSQNKGWRTPWFSINCT